MIRRAKAGKEIEVTAQSRAALPKPSVVVCAAPCTFTFVSSDGEFEGHAVKWGAQVQDLELMRGVFEESLQDTWPKMLWQHDTTQPIGRWIEIREDDEGLYVRGKLNLKVARAVEAKSLIEEQALEGLSVAFSVNEFEMNEEITEVTAAKLFEISLVTFPAQKEAQVDHETIQLYDRLSLNDVRETGDGYLAATARVARVGIQHYRGHEVGRPDLDVVRVYRPESEVFHKDSLRSYAHRPVTNDHPPVPVTSKNWKKYSAGQTGDDVLRDKDFVRVPLVLMDSAVISDYRNGKKELSLGYLTDLKWTPGETADGDQYDAVQTSIRANHLAVVAAARGGSSLRIGDDNDNGDSTMTTKPMTVDGISIMLDDTAAQVVTKFMATADASIAALKKALKEAEEERDAKKKEKDTKDAETVTLIATKDAEIVTLKKQVADNAITPDKLDAMVKDRAQVGGLARAVIGDKLVVDGKSVGEIRRQVVDAKLGDAAKGWTEDQVTASFNTLTAGVTAIDGGAGGDVRHSNQPGGGSRFADALSHPTRVADERDKALAERDKHLQDAWKTQKTA